MFINKSIETNRLFICLKAGVFPNVQDCQKYYICSDDGKGGFVTNQYQCDSLYTFHPNPPQNKYCRLSLNVQRFCVTANCQGSSINILMNYPLFPKSQGQIVATCQGNLNARVTRCDKGFLTNLNTNPVVCVPA